MPPRKTGLPVCQHILLGLQLLQAREQLMAASHTVHDGYAKTSKTATAAGKPAKDLDTLRSILDNESYRENPGEGAWSPAIYYCTNKDGWERDVLPIWRRHQAGNPDCCAGLPEPTR
jgi:hypothetical protein